MTFMLQERVMVVVSEIGDYRIGDEGNRETAKQITDSLVKA